MAKRVLVLLEPNKKRILFITYTTRLFSNFCRFYFTYTHIYIYFFLVGILYGKNSLESVSYTPKNLVQIETQNFIISFF